jgi:hypothetical protein
VGLIVRVSRELLEDGRNLDGASRDTLAASAALALDEAILFGTGTNNQSLGIYNLSGLPTVSLGVNGGTLAANWVPFLDALTLLVESNSEPPTAMVLAPRTSRRLNGFLAADGPPLTLPPSLPGCRPASPRHGATHGHRAVIGGARNFPTGVEVRASAAEVHAASGRKVEGYAATVDTEARSADRWTEPLLPAASRRASQSVTCCS